MIVKVLAGLMLLINSFTINSSEFSKPSNTDNSSVEINLVDKKAPDFSLKSVDGKEIKFSDYKDKVVIIDFWATWCPPCRRGIPDLISIQNEFKNDVVIVGISLDGDKTIKDVPGFVKEYGINYPVVYGDEKTVTAYGGIQAIPTSFVIDKKGNIVDQHVGLVDINVYVNKINDLLKK
ncbi:MAG: TlpA disulfide reductase family protein [Ignavibacteriaceae bacterium]|jgi:cytochrome c biogenesis protein CcmG/thiol:disulfide interchange protein DsbE|nr:TlpA disulfide reductase family protein [Ignavibacteriaceae bacterium]